MLKLPLFVPSYFDFSSPNLNSSSGTLGSASWISFNLFSGFYGWSLIFLAGVTNSVFFPLEWVLTVSIKVVLQKCRGVCQLSHCSVAFCWHGFMMYILCYHYSCYSHFTFLDYVNTSLYWIMLFLPPRSPFSLLCTWKNPLHFQNSIYTLFFLWSPFSVTITLLLLATIVLLHAWLLHWLHCILIVFLHISVFSLDNICWGQGLFLSVECCLSMLLSVQWLAIWIRFQ